MSGTNTINPETLMQFQRADEIINEATHAYAAEQSKNAMLLAQVRQDAAQKFAKDTNSIIQQVSDQYKTYLSRTGQHPDDIDTRGTTKLSLYRNPIVTPDGNYIGRFSYREMYDIYTAESQKACSNAGEMLRLLGFKISSAKTRYNGDVDHTDRNEPKYHHGCYFTFAAEELNKKK